MSSSASGVVHGEDFRGTKRFLVLRRLGAGGAGVVYEAFDREQGARVALKVLKKLHADALLRFKNEFRALQDLHHPNLVSLGESFEDNGQWFFTMEYVDGIDLLSYVHRTVRGSALDAIDDRTIADTIVDPPAPPSSRGAVDRPPSAEPGGAPSFDERRLRSAFVQLVRGVAALHAAGKVHRDIKASNVLVTLDGRVVLLDFGLIMEAKNAREEAQTHMVVGTEKYMAPEQAAAMPIGPQADCYSLGVVLYRSLTGQFPFGDASRRIALSRQRSRPAVAARRRGVDAGGSRRAVHAICSKVSAEPRRAARSSSGSTCARRSPASRSRRRASARPAGRSWGATWSSRSCATRSTRRCAAGRARSRSSASRASASRRSRGASRELAAEETGAVVLSEPLLRARERAVQGGRWDRRRARPRPREDAGDGRPRGDACRGRASSRRPSRS